MTQAQIKSIVTRHRMHTAPKLNKLKRYYLGQHDILSQAKASGKPDNRIACNFCRTITDSTVGYFMGKPVTYASASGDNMRLENEVTRISEYNDDQYVCGAIARDLSIFGIACELLWFDEDMQIRFSSVDPIQTIPVFGDDIDKNIIYALRTFKREDFIETNGLTSLHEQSSCREVSVIEIYDDTHVYEYIEKPDMLELVSSREHGFSQVPVNFYFNNSDSKGDFEDVISLIDAYNKIYSESVNDFELFADSYLVISGMGGTTPEDIARMRNDRVLLLDDGGAAEWLVKNAGDGRVEKLMEATSRDIFRISSSVDMSDDSFADSSASGISLRYKLLSFENRVAVTERYFKKGLQRRWELICELLNKLGENYDWRDIKIMFTRNLPFSITDTAETVKALDGVISTRTKLEQLPFVEHVEEEIKRLKEEHEQEQEREKEIESESV